MILPTRIIVNTRLHFIVFVTLLGFLQVKGNVSLPAIFSDHMVLQQDTLISIWGWAKPGETLRINGTWDSDTSYIHTVDSHAFWSIDIKTPAAGGPYNLSIQGYNHIVIEDILIGEVWLGSGQSNMEWTAASGIDQANEEIENANYPEIRFFTVLTSTASSPQQLLSGEWVVCKPETMKNFSALMYFFGRELNQELGVPVGLINSSWGGTPIEIWMPESRIIDDRLLNQNARLLKPIPWGPVEAGVAFNAMIHPLIPFGIKGALWYQGESNVDHPDHYALSLMTLIESWRASWGYDFSFYFAQIAPWAGYGSAHVKGAIIRDQQRKVLKLTNKTGMAVISDIGDLKNIHPGNKLDTGKRLAAWALSHDYGRTDLPFSGPLIRSCIWKKGKIILHFDYAEDGLSSGEEPLKEFQVLDEAGKWLYAEAVVKGSTVVVKSPFENPRGIRYAYTNDSNPNLFSKAGLPASCFEILCNPNP